jgi:hypothetical protein
MQFWFVTVAPKYYMYAAFSKDLRELAIIMFECFLHFGDETSTYAAESNLS